jgi:hypothetical protein
MNGCATNTLRKSQKVHPDRFQFGANSAHPEANVDIVNECTRTNYHEAHLDIDNCGGIMAKVTRFSKNLANVFAVLGMTACTVPRDMHITYGIDPKLVDDDVRFRTTYDCRTFEYCWDADVSLTQFPPSETDKQLAAEAGVPYRRIIPKTDSLYRYRMTGQASALFSRIRFESGVLKASTIDPFGTQVTYSRDADGFFVRSNSEVKADAEAALKAKSNLQQAQADRDAKLEKVRSLTDFYLKLPQDIPEAIRAAAQTTIEKALEDYRLAAAPTSAVPNFEAIQKELADLRTQISALSDEKVKAKVTEIIDGKITQLQAVAQKLAFNQLGLCRVDEKIRKGFQIMGPEGLKTFDQDDRLVMAMSSSAKPLVETLQEYSGRILDNRADPTAQLLAIANENLLTETARRKLADASRAEPDIGVLDDAIAAFSKPEEGTAK